MERERNRMKEEMKRSDMREKRLRLDQSLGPTSWGAQAKPLGYICAPKVFALSFSLITHLMPLLDESKRLDRPLVSAYVLF